MELAGWLQTPEFGLLLGVLGSPLVIQRNQVFATGGEFGFVPLAFAPVSVYQPPRIFSVVRNSVAHFRRALQSVSLHTELVAGAFGPAGKNTWLTSGPRFAWSDSNEP